MSSAKQSQGRKKNLATKAKSSSTRPVPPKLIVIRDGARYNPKKHWDQTG